MCGIAGWTGKGQGPGKPAMQNALACMQERGPDYQGIFEAPGSLLGHTRLSIIDTSPAGNQPFTIAGSPWVLVFNGEIFNYRELATTLPEEVKLKSHTDTEILFHLLELKGKAALQQLNGFFAFAWYNRENGELLLARDRMGIKPLYYAVNENGCSFSSEPKAIAHLNQNHEINADALWLYLRLTYIPAPYTANKEVKKLLPGTLLEYHPERGAAISRYYHLKRGGTNTNTSKEQLRILMKDSVRKRLMADVPVGTFLSGGIDSVIISALARQEQENIEAFTVAFPDQPFFDETPFAKISAKKHSIRHHVLEVGKNEVKEAIYKTLDYLDEPFADTSAIAVNLLCRQVSQHIKVALSGDGADELFAGYNKHRALLRLQKGGPLVNLLRLSAPMLAINGGSRSGRLSNKVRQLNRFAELANRPKTDWIWELCTFQSRDFAGRLLSGKGAESESKYISENLPEIRKGTLAEARYTDLTMVLPDDMLTKTDRMSMAASLEVRVPFLDHRVVEYALSIPHEQLLNPHQGKLFLREAFADLIPVEIQQKRKTGFEVPLAHWLRVLVPELVNDYLPAEPPPGAGMLNWQEVRHLVQRFQKGEDRFATSIWQLIVLMNWRRKYPHG